MAYFGEFEQVLYLSEDYLEKQTIEDGINRKLVPIRTIPGLVEEIEGSIGRQGRATVIITRNMSKTFEMYLKNVVEAFGTMDSNTLQVIEIGIGEVFPGALTFVDVLSFIEFVRKERRLEYIEDLEQRETAEADDESRVLRELMMEVDSGRERVKQFEKMIEEKSEELEAVSADYQALKTKVSHVYEIEIKNLKYEVTKNENELVELKRLYKIERETVKDYERELGEFRTKNKGLEIDKKSLQAVNEDRKQEIRMMENEIKKHKSEVEKLQKEKIDIIKSRVDAEEHVMLSKELDKERQRIKELQGQLEIMEVDNRKKDFNIVDLQTDISDLRRGEDDIQTYGRTQKLDTHTFGSTNLFYFKVITDLPYLMSSIQTFYDIIKEKFGGRTHVAILRNDEGMDSQYYKGIPLYGTIGDVKEEDEVFLLYPTRRMFTGANKFDGSVTSLLVIDYIRSSDYYLDTDAFGKYITVVRDSGMIRQYGLTGTPVSLDSGSMLDIRYDEKIELASVKRVRELIVRKKVETWMNSIGILNH